MFPSHDPALKNARQILAGEITGAERTKERSESIDKLLQKEILKALKARERDSKGKITTNKRADAFYGQFDSDLNNQIKSVLRGESTTHSSTGLKEKVIAFLTGTSDRQIQRKQIQKKQAIFGAVGYAGEKELFERFKQRLRKEALDSVKRGEYSPGEIQKWIEKKINIHSVASAYDSTEERKKQKKLKRSQIPSNIIASIVAGGENIKDRLATGSTWLDRS